MQENFKSFHIFFFSDTAYAKNKDDNRWYYFDDSSVSESQEESVCVSYFPPIFAEIPTLVFGQLILFKHLFIQSKAAYVLFYLRRNGNSRWLENIKAPLNKMSSPVHPSFFKSEVVNDSEEEMDSS